MFDTDLDLDIDVSRFERLYRCSSVPTGVPYVIHYFALRGVAVPGANLSPRDALHI